MEISLAGIEEALGRLGYRETSPKSRLLRALHNIYKNATATDELRSIDSDELIDTMWNLGGDRRAIRSRRKNLNSIKSSVNQDLDIAWEAGRNPEGITIGPLNTFVMSDAAKDKILNSFSGSMGLDGGKSLERVAEALKVVSDYLSEMPEDMEGQQLSNLKTLIEGLSDKFREDGEGQDRVIEKIIYRDGPEGEGEADDVEVVDEADLGEDDGGIEIEDADDLEIVDEEEISEEDAEDLLEIEGDGETDGAEDEGESELEIEDADDLEFVDEDELVEIEDEEAVIDDADDMGSEDSDVDDDGYGEEDAGEEGGENVVELVGAEGIEDADEIEIVYEDEPDDIEAEEGDADIIGEETDELDETMADMDVDEALEDESEDLGLMEEEDGLEEELAADADEVDDTAEIEWVDEDNVIDASDDFEEVFEDETDDLEEVLEDDFEAEGTGEEGDEDVVELMGADGLEDADEVELVDGDDLIEEEDDGLDDLEEIVEEDEGGELEDDVEVIEEEVAGDEEPEADETMYKEDTLGDDIGLPIDQLMEDLQDFEEFQLDEKQKRLLAERFDGYLGAMERYYNQYIFIKKGNYQVGTDAAGEDALNRQQVLMPDYYIGKYPVTNALFEVFIERTGYKTTAERVGYGYVYHGRFRKVVDPNTGFSSSIWNSTYTREKVKGAAWYQPLGPGSTLHKKRNHPVVQVSIKDARTFASWTGKRLPSEIEWEAAARSRNGFRYPWGNEWVQGFCNFENSGISDTCSVDHFPHSTNEVGLADLLGNVMEWTSDECEPKYPLETPTRFFIAKGGSWVSPEQTTLFGRNRLEENFTSNTIGFRCLAD